MMNYVWAGMMVISIFFGILTGRSAEVSDAVFSGADDAVSLFLTLLGVIIFWSGIMKIAEKAGVTTFFGRLCSPVLRLIFPGLPVESKAAKAISMNIAANILGLGNAATPLGINAMKELEAINGNKGVASNYMATFVTINTASFQLIPTTIAAMRSKNGSLNPFEIMPAVWLASIVSLLCGLIVAKVLSLRR